MRKSLTFKRGGMNPRLLAMPVFPVTASGADAVPIRRADRGGKMSVLETSRRVAEKSRHVRIHEEAVVPFSRELVSRGLVVPPWEDRYHFRGGDEETIAYLLVLDSLNFCFWPEPGKEKWAVPHESGWVSGYYALALSLKRTLEAGTPLADAEYLVCLSLERLKEILGGRGELQLLKARVEILRELGRVLVERFDGKAFKIVRSARASAVALTRLLAESLTSFKDVAEYCGEKVYFYKRAQIFSADLCGAFSGQAWGRFRDMQDLTAFADYKLPQVLRHLDILRYDERLGERVDQKVALEAGGVEEVEIRAATITAVDMIRQALAGLGKNLRAFEIDWILWNLGQEDRFRERPYHRTVTIFY
jgi:hypothetical protein